MALLEPPTSVRIVLPLGRTSHSEIEDSIESQLFKLHDRGLLSIQMGEDESVELSLERLSLGSD